MDKTESQSTHDPAGAPGPKKNPPKMFEPKTYSKHSDLQKTDNIFVLDKFFKLVTWRGGENVILDVGVGDGKFAVEQLLPLVPGTVTRFVGCDISEKMVCFARDNYKRPNMEFFQMDIACDAVPVDFEELFHHIFSFYTLHWVPKQRQAFANMYSMLRPGGDMLLSFLASNPIYEVYSNMSQDKKWKPYMKNEYICPYHGCKEPDKQVGKLLAEIGFVSHVCKVEKRAYYFPNLEVLKNSVVAVNPIIQKLPPDEVSNYMDDFVDHVRKLDSVSFDIVNNNEEGIHIKYDLLIVVASKPSEKC